MPESPLPPVERLYRHDSRCFEFDAAVLSCRPAGPGRFLVELNRTAFYPTGGGQPFDTGTLAGHRVIDVREAAGGRIEHLVEAPHPLTEQVPGRVDAARRLDHMQQHSGQHILSRAFVDLCGASTRSFHLGEAASTIDIELPVPDPERIRAAERLANEVVFDDAEVAVRLLPPGEAGPLAAEMNLARDLALKPGDAIRLIAIGAFDETPCGGTHVARTGQVGAIAVRSFEKFKGGTRVTFLCGGRVVRESARLGGIVDRLGARLSAAPDELEAALERVQAQVAQLRADAKQQGEALAEHEAAALMVKGVEIGGCHLVVAVLPGCGMERLGRIAQRLIAVPGAIALLSGIDEATGHAGFVFGRSGAGTPADLRMGELLSAVLLPRGGKGGGGPTLARGGGLAAGEAGVALDEARMRVASRLTT